MWTLGREVPTWRAPQGDTAAEPELEYSCKRDLIRGECQVSMLLFYKLLRNSDVNSTQLRLSALNVLCQQLLSRVIEMD